MGLIRLAAIFSPDVAQLWTAAQSWLALGALPVGAISWWLAHTHAAKERRRLTVPRHVTSEQRQSFIEWVKQREPLISWLRQGNARVVLVFFASDTDAARFAMDLQLAIANAGWHVHWAPQEGPTGITGVRAEVSRDAGDEERASAEALVEWLRRLDITAVGRLRTMPERLGYRMLKQHPIVQVGIRLTIGSRG